MNGYKTTKFVINLDRNGILDLLRSRFPTITFDDSTVIGIQEGGVRLSPVGVLKVHGEVTESLSPVSFTIGDTSKVPSLEALEKKYKPSFMDYVTTPLRDNK